MFSKLMIALVALGTVAGASAAQAGDFGYGHGYGHGYFYGHGYGYGGYVHVYTPPVYVPTCEKILTYDHYGNAYWVKSCH